MPLPKELIGTFDDALKKAGLQAHREPILNLARLTYELDPCKKKGELGSTKFGGPPELPLGTKWPKQDEGFLVFAGQINLAELPGLDDVLPRKGLLSFFFGTDEPAYDIENQILYFENPQNLTRLKPPANDEYIPGCMQDYDKPVFGEAWVKITPTVALPHYSELEGVSDDAFDKLKNLFDSPESYMLGITNDYCRDCGLDAAIIHSEYKEFLHTPQTVEYFQERLDEALKSDRTEYAVRMLEQQPRHKKYCEALNQIRQEALHWQNLLVLDSHSELAMCWWDAGTLGFLGHAEKIRRSDFGGTYAAISSS